MIAKPHTVEGTSTVTYSTLPVDYPFTCTGCTGTGIRSKDFMLHPSQATANSVKKYERNP
jgi:hypothetical protein